MHYLELRNIARKRRRSPTPSEAALWMRLRHRRLDGFRFLRQHPIYYERKANDLNFFIANFFCAELHLIIEVDYGIQDKTADHDRLREEVIELKGFGVLRIKDAELEETNRVVEKIREFIRSHPKRTYRSRTHR